MANPNTPYGLQAIQSLGSETFRSSLTMYYVPANTTNAMYVGDPVVKVAGSADAKGVNGINLVTSASAVRITGVICGFVPQFANSGSPGPMYKPANASVAYYALVNDDPRALYVVQSSDGNGAQYPAAAVVGKNCNLVSGAGSAYTGWSGWRANIYNDIAGATCQLNIVGAFQSPDNTIGISNSKWLVRINQDTEVNAALGI